MSAIGGYFEMELPEGDVSKLPAGILVNSGRHALEYIIRSVGKQIRTIWLPYYTCDVILQPIRRAGLNFRFYSIDKKLEIDDNIVLKDDEYIIVNNYFGIKDEYISKLIRIYRKRLIVDNAQAFYCPEELGSNYIYSPRKFFGLPDGGIVFSTSLLEEELPQGLSYDRCSHLLKRIDKDAGYGYDDFKTNSLKLNDEPLSCMSKLTQRLLGTINYDWAKIKRTSNYEMLHSALSSSNLLQLPNRDTFTCPMIYPYCSNDNSLRKKLIDNKIYVATYWPNVFKWCSKETLEYQFAETIIPLPIDQRYDYEDMERIINVINS